MSDFKNTIEGRRFLNKIFYRKSLTYKKFVDDLNFNDVVPLIKCIDQDCEDWETTEKLFHYFASEICNLLTETDNLDNINNETIFMIDKLKECLEDNKNGVK